MIEPNNQNPQYELANQILEDRKAYMKLKKREAICYLILCVVNLLLLLFLLT